MTITFNPWRAFWLVLWLALLVTGYLVAHDTADLRAYWGGYLTASSMAAWVVYLWFYEIRGRKP